MEIIEDGGSVVWGSRVEPKDTGTNQQAPAAGFRRRVLSGGVHTFDMNFRGTTPGTTGRLAQANFEFYQVP